MQELDDAQIAHLAPLASTAGAHAADLVEAMFLMAAADGEISEVEIRTLARSCSRLGLSLTEAELEAKMHALHTAIEKDGWETRVSAVGKALSGTALAETAYRLAVSVALADDYVVGEEMNAMDTLAAALGIDSDRSHVILREVHDTLFAALRQG
jgi:tellurite resistance protein